MVAKSLKTALLLYLGVIKKVLIGGFDMDNSKKNRENTIWDVYQLFSINDEKINRFDLVFVTAEKWLHEVGSGKRFIQ